VITKRPDPEGRIGEVSGSKRFCCCRGLTELMGEKLMVEKMTTDIHSRRSGKSHGRGHKKEDAKVNSKKISPEEVEMEEYICEPEQGEFLGDSEDEGLNTETSSKPKGSHCFKTDNLWMFAGERQLADIVMKKEKYQQNQNSVLEKHKVDRSYIQLEKLIMENQRRGLETWHRNGMTAGVREREIAVMKIQLQVLEEWLQEQKNQNRKWIFPLKGKRMIWQQLQRRLRKIVSALLKEELRVLEPEMEFEDSKCRFVQKEIMEEAVKTEKSCDLKTNGLHMFAGTEQGDE